MGKVAMSFKRIRFSLFLFLAFSAVGIQGQSLQIREDPGITRLMQQYIEWNLQEKQLEGWRIQIINTDDRRRMETALSNFKHHFPGIRYVKWRQLSPYYRVMIGAFETKLEVLAFLQEVKEYFPSAIPVVEKMDETEFLNR